MDYSDALIEEYKQGMLTDPIMYPQNNWLDIMYNNAFIMSITCVSPEVMINIRIPYL